MVLTVWGSFGVVHILSLLLSVAVTAGLYFLLRRTSPARQTALLGVLSFAGIAAILFNLLAWQSPLEYLPLHLCSLTALCLPAAVFTRSKTLGNLLLLWGLGAFMALAVNTAQAHFVIGTWTFFFYYVPHTLEAAVIVLLFALGLVKLDYRTIPCTLGITAAAYTAVHFLNLAINAYCERALITDYAGDAVRVNYMYSLWPENPVLDMLFTVPYWYMYGILPLILLYLTALYLPAYLRKRKETEK